MATAVQNLTGTDTDEEIKYGVGVLAGLEWSPVPNAKLLTTERNAIKELVKKAARRDYPARLIEIIATWEAALFYRGFQFLIPERGGGWKIPGESTGYGASMQMDLALLPTNIYSARGQMIIAALTRTVPSVRFAPQDGTSDAQITAADSADKFVKVISRNNDLIVIQTDASRYLWTDGRFGYWSRFEKNGQAYGWEEDDEPDDMVPESAGGGDDPSQSAVENDASDVTERPALEEGSAAETDEEAGEQTITPVEEDAEEISESDEDDEDDDENPVFKKRTPRGQEVRTAHGKLEMKLVPMMANDLPDVDALQLDLEVDVSRAKGMFPWMADKISAGSMSITEGEIARLARQNVKLGMQSAYVTSDSVANDVTISRTWFRPSALMDISDDTIREKMIAMFPNGCLACFVGEHFAYARNESMDDSWALGQAYSGDGQNRNAMGTSTLPIQKRLNNWLDLMNDLFVRAIPKKWMDAKTFNVEALRGQTNVPGDIGSFKWQQGKPIAELIYVEEAVEPPQGLADFIKEYSGPLAELLSGAYPALAGGDVGTADSGVAIATQRDSALGRLAPTWHSIKKAEATSMKQLVRWGAKCRDGSINERVPGGETITLEINDLKANLLCFAESDENFPETYTQRKNAIMQVFNDSSKSPELQEVLYNGANLEFMQDMIGARDLYIPQVLAHKKQLGEIEVLSKSKPVPSPQYEAAVAAMTKFHEAGVDPAELQQAEQQLADLPKEMTSLPIDAQVDDNDTEMATCWMWLNGEEGRKMKRIKKDSYENVRLHFLDHQAASQAKAAKAAAMAAPGKPPSVSANYKDVAANDAGAGAQILAKAGIAPTPGTTAPPPVPPAPGGPAPASPLTAPQTPTGAGGPPKQ